MRWIAGALALIGLSLTGAEAAPLSTEVQLGQATLQGTLLMPEAASPVPAVLIIAGSGPTDRDGNSSIASVHPNTYRMLSEGLAARGVASLRVDKRGIGGSAKALTAEKDIRFQTYVDDAVAWADFLRTQPQISCVVILGHSEGALIGALAAAKTKICGYISVSGAGEPFGRVLLRQLSASHDRGELPEPYWSEVQTDIAKLEAAQTIANVPPGLMALFRPAIQPYLIDEFAIDPKKAVADVKAPVLILQGTTDIQVSVADAQALAAAHPGAKLVLLDGVNHVLKDAPAERAANVATYSDPNLPLDARIVPAIAGFLKAL